MAKKPKKMWVFAPTKTVPTVSDQFKSEVKDKADQWVDEVLKPKHIKPPPEDNDYNYLVDISTKWYRQYFYIQGKYCCPSPNAISPDFEVKFARMEYIDLDRFNLSYFRHTGQWHELYQRLSLQECLARIDEDPFFIVG